MATDQDLIIDKCECCKVTPITPQLRRPQVSVQLNGPGGVWPAARLVKDDVIEVAFRKNGAAWQTLPRSYEIKYSATEPNILVMYVTVKLEDTNF